MIISKRSMCTGKINTMDLDIEEAQVFAWEAGALIQNVMPNLSADEREFLISGCSPEEFNNEFGEEEE